MRKQNKYNNSFLFELYTIKEEDIEYYFLYLDYDPRVRRMIYTTIWIKRFNKNCYRTLKIRNSFPTPEVALALITSVAIEKLEKQYAYLIHNFNLEKIFVNLLKTSSPDTLKWTVSLCILYGHL